MTEILKNIYLGDKNIAIDKGILIGCGITHVINCTVGIPNFYSWDYPAVSYLKLGLTDEENYPLKERLVEALKFIEQTRVTGGSILIHCRDGTSRAPIIICYYIMKRHNTGYDAAIQFIRKRYPIAHPHFAYEKQLRTNFSIPYHIGDNRRKDHVHHRDYAVNHKSFPLTTVAEGW